MCRPRVVGKGQGLGAWGLMEGLVKLLRHFLENVLHDTQKSINYQPKSFSEAPCFGIQALPMNSMRAKCRATGTWKGCAGCSSFRGSGYSGLGSFGCCMLLAPLGLDLQLEIRRAKLLTLPSPGKDRKTGETRRYGIWKPCASYTPYSDCESATAPNSKQPTSSTA